AVPAQFGSVSATWLEAAGRSPDAETLESEAQALLDLGKTGPAAVLVEAERMGRSLNDLPETESPLAAEIAAYRTEHPQLAYIGGPDPFFEQFLKLIKVPEDQTGPVTVNALLIPARNRAELLAFLQNSSNATVLKLLETRELTTVTRFMPVSAPAGAPLESAILTSALLVQGEDFSPQTVRAIRALATAALEGDNTAVDKLEAFYLSVLGSAGRMDWVTLAEWTSHAESWTDLTALTTLLRQNSDYQPLLYGAVLLSDNPRAVIDYLGRAPDETAWRDISLALVNGKAALGAVLESGRPVYHPPVWLAPLVGSVPAGWIDLAVGHPVAALALKLVLFFLAGFFLAMCLKRIFAGQAMREARRRGLLAVVVDAGLGGALVLILVLASEPNLLAQPVSEPGKSFLEFEIVNPADIIKEQGMDIPQLDQVTLVVLLIFFVLQLLIYSICLIKLAQVRNAPVPSAMKIKLLENEENLFDAGLYVGLTGTIISLLMLAMGIVQASLVAAYASTLFGIIFVALLKILNVRPLRRKLILEAGVR
ncbi:MAG: hypothetical protein ACQKBW_12120, partial [Puniceicoccales bacterium]